MTPEVFRNALILTGPTGAGKSRLALALAEQLHAEIVAMDSMTLYRGMDIGTAKPGPDELSRVPHHLLDVLDPWESASVAWWLERAAACCRDIEARGRRVLFVGGTPLYLKALLHGLFDGPPADAEVRGRLTREAEEQGREVLHARLAGIDATTANRLHPNDVRRVIRALEVWELTGKPISSWQTQWREPVEQDGPPRCLWLDLPRDVLYQRIDRRVEVMVEAGLFEEVASLVRLPRPLSQEARQALGYKEAFDFLEGRASREETVRLIQQRTRNYAKRQLTWFRNLEGCRPATEELTFSLWVSRIEGV
jgi:tRNA dimethylallyltransferase